MPWLRKADAIGEHHSAEKSVPTSSYNHIMWVLLVAGAAYSMEDQGLAMPESGRDRCVRDIGETMETEKNGGVAASRPNCSEGMVVADWYSPQGDQDGQFPPHRQAP